MRINFDFWYIKRDNDNFIVEAGVHYYEGDYFQTQKLDVETMQQKQVLEYKRTKKLSKKDLTFCKRFRKDFYGDDAVVYTVVDFGKIKTEEELNAFLINEIAKSTDRNPVSEQIKQ